jgi:tRNA(Ile)-lysidine synthase
MIHALINFISRHQLVPAEAKLLLAVSGGVDSVVMAHLFADAGWRFAIVHANFHLRGSESDEDQEFVAQLAEKLKVPFFAKSLNAKQMQSEPGISTQMAARELRYAWFEQLRVDESFDLIATAHHQDDQIETFFINLLRGTGLAGLHGIPLKQGFIIRPLLFATRDEILAFARKQDLTYREDSSNAQTHYLRNKIRHELLPIVASIQPKYRDTLSHSMRLIRESESMLESVIREKEKALLKKKEGQIELSIPALLELSPLFPWLYALLSPFGFNAETLHDLVKGLEGSSGKQYFSTTHQITKDRNTLIICPLTESDKVQTKESYFIPESETKLEDPIPLQWETKNNAPDFPLVQDASIALIDRSKLTFPLTLRKWKPGDYFHPFGMTKKKKLSDFFVDEKIPLPEKEKIWLLCSDDKIVWIIGHRMDNRFRVTENTQEILEVRVQQVS